MKKLLGILVLGLLLSSNAYAKIIKLSCIFEKAYEYSLSGISIKMTEDNELY